MRKLAAVLAFVGVLAQVAHAQSQPTVAVAEAYQSTTSCYAVQVSSFGDTQRGATQVISSTGTLWRNAELWNLDASAVVNCDPYSSAVSSQTTTFSAQIGFPVQPSGTSNGLPVPLPLAPSETLYCVNSTTGASSKQTVFVICLGR